MDVVAGASVTDRERALDCVRAGGCGTDLHDACVEKVYVTSQKDLSELTLETTN